MSVIKSKFELNEEVVIKKLNLKCFVDEIFVSSYGIAYSLVWENCGVLNRTKAHETELCENVEDE